VAYHLIWKALHTKHGKHHFIFETSPKTKPKEKKVGGTWHIMTPVQKKWGGHVPRVPHQMRPCIQPVMNKNLDLCPKHVILFRHNGTGIQRSQCMQHATAHHAFRAAVKLTAYVDRAGTTNLMFSKILSFGGLTNFKLKWIWFCSEGNSDDLLFVVHLKIFWLLL